ncbi:hypothetical protein HPMG_00204 [Helicobacter pullorum MIT 98-5489]|uniref:Uncharacterized protein n=1 Tax=Helicobacter pullorum MIT 98-5489 TaxID=537972 RepID=C5EXX7_9HELI|nr:hypothetical protein HPMG_00204 [Helicobacter pullorum MIT 98-5489]
MPKFILRSKIILFRLFPAKLVSINIESFTPKSIHKTSYPKLNSHLKKSKFLFFLALFCYNPFRCSEWLLFKEESPSCFGIGFHLTNG